MSRLGKLELVIPEKTDVTQNGGTFSVKGPLGELTKKFTPEVKVTVAEGKVTLAPTKTSKLAKALWGTYAAHIQNMLKGVNTPFEKKLIIEGVGYRAEASGNKVNLALGFSHPVVLTAPEGVSVVVEKNNITISGIDKEKVGQFAAVIRAHKKPEPYKGKGIRYSDEVIRRKQGKKGTA